MHWVDKLVSNYDLGTRYQLAKRSDLLPKAVNTLVERKNKIDNLPLGTAVKIAKGIGISVDDLHKMAKKEEISEDK